MHHCHHENGAAAAHNHRNSVVDRLLLRLSVNKGQELEKVNNIVVMGESPNGSCKKLVCSRGHWKPLEDVKLRELVAIHGPQNWNFMAEQLGGRSGKSCRLRWYNQLDPKINKRAFTEEEDERLMEVHRVYGNKWAFISRFFPGRTDNSVKNQWHVLMARKYREKSKRKYSSNQKALERRLMEELKLQNSSREDVYGSNYDHFVHGSESKSWNMTRENIQEPRNHYDHMPLSRTPYSPAGSTSQISFAASISPSPSLADHYQESTDFLQNSAKPMFIDFLGVGAI